MEQRKKHLKDKIKSKEKEKEIRTQSLCRCFINAANPETIGVANDVPFANGVSNFWSSSVVSAARMDSPTA